jgi:hypothetical protein
VCAAYYDYLHSDACSARPAAAVGTNTQKSKNNDKLKGDLPETKKATQRGGSF